MHSRPDVIQLQAQKQFENLFIGFDAYGILSHVALYPVLQLLLVVDEDAAVFYFRMVCVGHAGLEDNLLFPAHRDIGEKVPGRYAQPPAADFVDAVYRSAPVAAGDEKLAVFFLNQKSFLFKRLLSNTLLLNVYNLLWSFPIPLILALFLNRIKGKRLKRFVQTSIYVPYFISTVVLAGMLYIFLSPTSGILNLIRTALGFPAVDYMSSAEAFRTIYIISGIWQGAGWGTILYIASLAGVDQSLYEAAEIDGASIWQEIRYIDLPTLIPVAMMVLILDCGKLLSSNTDKALVMQTAGNIPTSDIIGVYVYNVGLGSGQFSYTTAIGLFINVINFILIITVNKISKKTSDIGLF